MRTAWLVLLSALIWTVPAEAAHSITMTYQGILVSGTDATNTWGTGSTDLTGQPFDLTYTYNFYLGSGTAGAAGTGPLDDFDVFYSLEYFGPGLVTLTINGISVSFTGSGIHLLTGDSLFFVEPSLLDTVGDMDGSSVTTGITPSFGQLPLPGQLDTPFSSFPDTFQTQSGSGFNFSTPDQETSGAFDVMSYELTAILPEPTIWALMLSGFGLLGLLLRHKSTGTRQARVLPDAV